MPFFRAARRAVRYAPAVLSLIVPVFNEEGAVEPTVRSLHAALSGLQDPWEILVVDDGSTDRTAAILAGLDLPQVRVLAHARNLGNGAAIKTGIRQAQGDILGTIDADGTYPIAEVPTLYRRLLSENADMIVGARPAVDGHTPFLHRAAKSLLFSFAERVAQARIPDLNSGLRLFRRDLCERFTELYPERFSFHITITLAALCNGYAVEYVPIGYAPRIGRSKLSAGLRGPLNFLRFCHRILRIVSRFRPLRFFLPPGIAAFLFGVLGFAVLRFFPELLVPSAVLFLAGMQIIFFGVIAEMAVRSRPAAPLSGTLATDE
jgi:glycosyltransferase involved in cell wall biosynthesis